MEKGILAGIILESRQILEFMPAEVAIFQRQQTTVKADDS